MLNGWALGLTPHRSYRASWAWAPALDGTLADSSTRSTEDRHRACTTKRFDSRHHHHTRRNSLHGISSGEPVTGSSPLRARRGRARRGGKSPAPSCRSPRMCERCGCAISPDRLGAVPQCLLRVECASTATSSALFATSVTLHATFRRRRAASLPCPAQSAEARPPQPRRRGTQTGPASPPRGRPRTHRLDAPNSQRSD
jgi:hypothetical protein